MKRRRVLFIFLLAALCLVNYPFIRQTVDKWYQQRQAERYEEEVKVLSREVKEQIWKAATAYNSRLAQAEQSLKDGFTETLTGDKEYQDLLNPWGNGLMGYVEIPALDLRLPLFHGTDVDTLEHGVGHLKGSSLPVGGSSTHAVLSAHRGLPSRDLFMNLDQLEIGDRFILSILGERLVYQIDQIRTVSPEETESLTVREGADYVTLVTCTPFGINSHRLLVRGVRVSDNRDTGRNVTGGWGNILQSIFILSIAGIGIMVKVLLLPQKRNK